MTFRPGTAEECQKTIELFRSAIERHHPLTDGEAFGQEFRDSIQDHFGPCEFTSDWTRLRIRRVESDPDGLRMQIWLQL